MTEGRSRYDRAYFDRWYRDGERAVFTRGERARRVAVAVAAAEYVLDRRLRNTLDIGAGEGHWRAPLLALRPRATYEGIDPSTYAVNRFGAARNIRLGSIESLSAMTFRTTYDLVLAVGFLNMLEPAALRRALRDLRPLVRGVALLEIFTREDPLTGDTRRYNLAARSTYERMLAQAGFVPVGLHMYATEDIADAIADLERLR